MIALIVVWGLTFSATLPIRQAYLNGMIPSRAAGHDPLLRHPDELGRRGLATQPALGRAADAYGYAPTYVASSAIMLLGLPFLALSRRQDHPADTQAAAEAQPA